MHSSGVLLMSCEELHIWSAQAVSAWVPMRRRRTWCIPDEQYFGTLLSWKLEDDLAWQYTNDLAMAPVHDGDGVPPDQINTELLIQIRGSTLDTSRVPQYHIRHGECHAVER